MAYHYTYNKTLISFSQANRRTQTHAEQKLWFHLRSRQLKGYKFRRQYPIQNYILDFYCIEKKLAIELDGGQHITNNVKDDIRTKNLTILGITVLRFWDNEVLANIQEVLEEILRQIESLENTTSS